MPQKSKNQTLHTDPVFSKSKQEVAVLDQARQILCQKIKEIENRLQFGYSEPLNQYRIELLRQDMQLVCQMTDLLTE